MGTIQKIGEDYFIEFYARGLKYQQKAGPDRKAAQKALEEIEAKIARGEAAIIVRDVDIDIFLKDFLHYSQTQHTPKTVRRFQSLKKYFLSFLEQQMPTVVKLSQVTPVVVEQYKNSVRQPEFINLTIILLREVFAYAIKSGYLNDDPSLHICFVNPIKTKKISVVTEEEKSILVKYASPGLVMMIEMILGTGISVEELTDLTWADIDWLNRVIKVPSRRGCDIPMVSKVIEILQGRKEGRQSSGYIFTDTEGQKLNVMLLKKELRKIVGQSDLEKEITFDAFCHTFAQGLIRKNISWGRLYRILGYDDIAQILVYTVFAPGVHLGQVYNVMETT